jgi:PAS domain S-box-containing protein
MNRSDKDLARARSPRRLYLLCALMLPAIIITVNWFASFLAPIAPMPVLALVQAGMDTLLFSLCVRYLAFGVAGVTECDERSPAEQIIDDAVDGILTIDRRGQILTLNPAAEKLFGLRAAEVVNQPITMLLAEPPSQCRPSQLSESLPAGSILGLAAGAREVIGRRKNGDTFSVELTGSGVNLGDDSSSVIFVRDVSKRKRAQRYLIAHYAATCILAEANTLADALPRLVQTICEALQWEAGAYWSVDRESGVALCGKVYQTPRSAFTLTPHTEPLACKPDQGLPGRVWATGEPAWVEDISGCENCPCQALSSTLQLHGAFGFPILLGEEVCGVMTFFSARKQKRDQQLLDILVELGKQLDRFVARKRDEEMLRDTTQTLKALVYAAPVAIHITDLEGKVQLWNPTAERIFGWTAAEIMGQTLPAIQGDRDAAGENQSLIAQHSGSRHGSPIRCPRKDGTVIEVNLSTAQLVDAAGTVLGVLSIRMDLTQQKKLEDQLRQAHKMEAVGQLAGGVAHDFNNLLTVIMGYSEEMIEKLRPEDPMRALLQEVHKAGERAAGLTRQLLAFSRKQILQPRVLDLNELVANVQKMLGRLIGEDIQLSINLAPGLGRVKADPGQIEQILINLAVNARDAMPTGGKLSIETNNVVIDEGQALTCAELPPGRYVRLVVGDTGCGMDVRTLDHMFEPFFTTKELGKGTGLGLATVYGIIKQSGGHVRASSELGKGASFEIYLPTIEASVAERGPSLYRLAAPGGNETVLLVEDEDGLRGLTSQVLQTHGYTVLEANNGVEALRITEKAEVAVDLLLTDVVMPRLGGRALAEAIASRYPKANVLYISGYTDDAVIRNGVFQAENEFLQKPFTMDAMLRKVREVLDKKKGNPIHSDGTPSAALSAV